jgi:hypothetical protein
MSGASKNAEVIAAKLSALKEGNFKELVKYIARYFQYIYFSTLKSGSEFVAEGKRCKYFFNMYNSTWRYERAVEIPIIMGFIGENTNVLEIGNVLSHYCDFRHDIVDKYEKYPGVVNEDITEYRTNQRYDLIASISTFEHIGYDEEQKDENKILKALECAKNLLKPGGKVIVTLPVCYNKPMDKMLFDGRIKFDRTICLSRSGYCEWEQVGGFDEIRNAKFNEPYPQANALVVGIIER